MNYSALIQNRRSFREFTDKEVPYSLLDVIKGYYLNDVRRLIPEIKTELYFFSTSTRAALEGAAGYNQFLIGAPQYLVLMSEKHTLAGLNAGYVMEDLILKLEDLGLDSCWLTFADSDEIKESLGIESDLEVAAIAAFGYGKKTVKRLQLNMRSMSDVDIQAKYRYMEPKRSVRDMVYIETGGNRYGLERYIGVYDDMLWESLYAVSLAPSYLNRQAYDFLLHNGQISLVSKPDAFSHPLSEVLSLGIALLHFSAVAEKWSGPVRWQFEESGDGLRIPEGHKLIATASL